MKKIFSILMALVMFITVSAQNYEYPGVFGMPYVNLNAGAVTPLSNFKDFDAGKIVPAAGLELGTYVTPIWGASIEGVAAFDFSSAEDKTLIGHHFVLGNGKMNVSNFLAGYKGYPRRVEFVLVAGAGWERAYWKVPVNEENADYQLAHADGMVYNTGAEINVNLGEKRAWQINVRPSVIWRHSAENQFGFNPQNAVARLNVGVTYKFGNCKIKSHNFVTNDYAVSQHDYDVLMARYEECSKRQPEVREVEVEKVVERVERYGVPTYFGDTYVTFKIGSSKLDANAKAIIRQFAKNLDGKKVRVYVVGSADSKTGSETRNYTLAEARAKVVKEVLVKEYGVAEEDVIVDTTLDATDDVKTSRAAVLTISEKE